MCVCKICSVLVFMWEKNYLQVNFFNDGFFLNFSIYVEQELILIKDLYNEIRVRHMARGGLQKYTSLKNL